MKKNAVKVSANKKKILTLQKIHAVVAQLVEHQLPKLRVAGSSPVYRSFHPQRRVLPNPGRHAVVILDPVPQYLLTLGRSSVV